MFSASRQNGYGEVVYFPLEFKTLLALQTVRIWEKDDKPGIAKKAGDQNIETAVKNGQQILTVSRPFQTGNKNVLWTAAGKRQTL